MSSSENSSVYSSDDLSASSDDIHSDDNKQDNLSLKGELLNKYNIIYEIGRGADAIVWLGYNIEDSNYYAIKINEPNEYKKGSEEFKFLKKLPEKLSCFNHLKENFVEIQNDKKYACGVFELQTGNLDAVVRKGEYQDGLPVKVVKKMMFNLLTALKYLHQKMKVFHADIKTDNILLKGHNNYDKQMIKQYNEANFLEKYKKEINQKDLNPKDKLKIRREIHKNICDNLKFPEKDQKYIIDDDYISNSNVVLSDFGAWCGEEESYETEFGTRYYRAPEIILNGECRYPVDIWAAGCVFYELLTGRILFDPEKDSKRTRDDYHLYYINCRCGDFNKGFLKKTEKHKEFFTPECNLKKFNSFEEKNLEQLLTKYNIVENKSEILDLLKGMLIIQPNQRFDADKCLNHPFFKV
jgi:serine/threonine protein kinase